MILQPRFAMGRRNFSGFDHYSPLTINSGQVPSTQTDFPILISLTDNRLKTIANGGHVRDAQGDDIRPYTGSGAFNAITAYEKVFYDGTNGILEMWVKRSSVADGLVTNLAYGNPNLTTDASSSTTWSNNFTGVWHLADGTTLSLTDSTSNARTLTNTNTVTATTGQIDGAGGFLSASNQYLRRDTFAVSPAVTLSAWVKATSFPNAYNTVISFTGSAKFALINVKSTGKLNPGVAATTDIFYDGTGSHTLSTGTWYLLHLTYDSSAGLVAFVNAASDGTVSANGTVDTAAASFAIGQDRSTSSSAWNGPIDEGRTASVARSQDWITTEYNNQSAPATFMTLGTEV